MAKDMNDKGLENEFKGSAKELTGKIRGDIGDATDNDSEHIKGRVEELKGKVQKNFGRAQQDADREDV